MWKPLRFIVASVAVVIACSTPTGSMCACPPSRSIVVLAGTLVDSTGSPVVGARVFADGIPSERLDTFASIRIGDLWALSDAAGRFAVTAYSMWSPGMQVLRVAVTPRGDTAQRVLPPSHARFVHERDRPDTVRRTLVLR